MRILRVAQKVYPEFTGGGAYHVHALCRDQSEMGHDVTLLTVSKDASADRREERDGYTVVRRPPTVEVLGNTVSAGVARFLRTTDRFDVVHAHSHLYASTNLAAVARRFGDTPLIITNHGLYSQSAPERLFGGYLRTLGRWTLDTADVVLCYTDEDERRLRDLGVSARVEVVANGVDGDRFTPEGPRSGRIDTDGPVVLFVGRLVEGKRPGDALEAVAELRASVPGVSLYFCGDGPLAGTLRGQAVEHGIEDSVTFLGHVPHGEMPRVYRSADVLVLPSRAEGFPRTVIEALASGVPVVTSDLDQLEATVERAGETVPVGEVRRLVEALYDLLADERRRRELGQRGRALVEREFQWETTVRETTRLSRELLG